VIQTILLSVDCWLAWSIKRDQLGHLEQISDAQKHDFSRFGAIPKDQVTRSNSNRREYGIWDLRLTKIRHLCFLISLISAAPWTIFPVAFHNSG